MPVPSQRPLFNKLLACDPLIVGGKELTSIDAALASIDSRFSIDDLAVALARHDMPISRDTLFRWRREI